MLIMDNAQILALFQEIQLYTILIILHSNVLKTVQIIISRMT